MSVILFAPTSVYKELADAYEALKGLVRLHSSAEADQHFYTALRRLYFANVAAYLCQYHDETPLSAAELSAIAPFVSLAGDAERGGFASSLDAANQFLSAWSLLAYNLMTNDGERYHARDSVRLMEDLATRIATTVIADAVAASEHVRYDHASERR